MIFATEFPIPRRESGDVEKNNGMNSFIARMATHALFGNLSILKSESAIDLVKSRTFKWFNGAVKKLFSYTKR